MKQDSNEKTARRPPGDEAEIVQSVNGQSVAEDAGSIKPRGAVPVDRDRAKSVFSHSAAKEIARSVYRAALTNEKATPYTDGDGAITHLIVNVEGAEGPFQIRLWFDGTDVRHSRIANGQAARHHGVQKIVEQHLSAQRLATDHNVHRKLTDSGNAERFVDNWHAIAKFNATRKSWMLWTGKVYVLDRAGTVHHLGLLSVRRIYAEAEHLEDEARRRATAEWAKKSEDAKRRKSMVDLAKSDPRVAVTDDMFDTHPEELNTHSGIVNLRTGELRPHDPSDYHSRIAGTAFRPELLERGPDQMPRYVEEAPNFSKFLADITLGRRDLADYIQRYIGYAATGYASEEICAFAVGNGGNGKGTLTEAILNVLGDYATVADPSLMLDAGRRGSGPSPEIAGLRGVRFLVVTESDDGDRLSEAKFKWLTGSDTLTGRHLYGDAITFRPIFSPWYQTNHRPRITTGGYAVWRRVSVVPFDFEARGEAIDSELKQKLPAEHEAILAWIVEGAIRWFAHGLPSSPTVDAATAEYRTNEDRILPFLQEETRQDMTGTLKSSQVYKRYRQWSADRGEHPMSAKAFHSAMDERGYRKDHFRDGDYYLNLQFSGVL